MVILMNEVKCESERFLDVPMAVGMQQEHALGLLLEVYGHRGKSCKICQADFTMLKSWRAFSFYITRGSRLGPPPSQF